MNELTVLFINWDINPRVFPFSEIPRWYGLLWVLGIAGVYRVMMHIFKVEGRSTEQLDRLALYLIIGTLVGARLGHVFFYEPAYFLAHPIEILPIKLEPEFRFTGLAGLASHGGGIGVLLALALYCRRYGEGYLWVLDRLVIGAAFLGCCIRLGNLMNSEMIGIPTEVPWAFVFLRVDTVPRHPAQLYEAIYCLGLFFFLFARWKNHWKDWKAGSQLGLFFVILFSLRFWDEFFKIDQVPFEQDMLFNMGQLLSIPYILAGLIILYYAHSRAKKS